MAKNSRFFLWCLLLAAGLIAGCKPKPRAEPANASAYFKTPFQDESQYIVEAIVSDLAEEMFYAASGQLPDQKYFSVVATEKPGSPLDEPVYELEIRLAPKQRPLTLEVNVNGPIWSPAVYRKVAARLAETVKLHAGIPSGPEDTTLLSALTDGAPETIERENEKLSAALAKSFRNPELHEKAALLLGAFLLREHSGHFFEIRAPLSRMTAHLAMADYLSDGQAYGVNGRMAEAILLTMIGDEAPALKQLDGIGASDPATVAFARTLRMRNTGDYRLLDGVRNPTPIENTEHFCSQANYISVSMAWPKLSDEQQHTIDFVRIANQNSYSVEIGHQLLQVSIPLELEEISQVYQLSHPHQLKWGELAEALNQTPERCFSREADGAVQVHVIGWGQWAMFLQRHLCHAIQQNFYFMYYAWGVPDEAKDFAAKCDQEFGGLHLYPFVRRFDCTDEASYHSAVDDGFKVTVATPQFVPAQCWNYLCYKVSFAPWYQPNPNPHVNEWHHHNPPPGTVYDLDPRLNHPSLTDRPDAVAFFEKLHDLAPYDCRIANFIVKKKYHNHPTYDQALALYHAVLPYSEVALRAVANTAYDKPKQYEKLMLKAAKLDPVCYYDLGDYFIERHEEDRGAPYINQACAADPDSVRVSNHAVWRVRYCLEQGQTNKASEIASQAAEVYSYTGLEAEAIFLEATTNYDGAFNYYSKIEERYDDSIPLVDFCLRYQTATGDLRFAAAVQKRMSRLFPKGVEKVSLGDFHNPPADGVLIAQQNERIKSAGLKAGDVIVAVYGIRVHNTVQYSYGRQLKSTPELDLIVWQDGAYREFKPSPPHHLFGVNFSDYHAQ